jgi:signal transduction histidine kinase/CheY-like chemotaxis protein
MTPTGLDLAQLEQLYTIVLAIDADGQLQHSSTALRRHLPDCTAGSAFFDHFEIMRPARLNRIEQLLAPPRSLFLIKDHRSRFAARGQMLRLHREGHDLICFCGSPWLFWMNTHCPDVKLGLADFPPQDSQLDQLFLMTTEQRMVADLEKLNAELQSARRDTEAAQRAKEELFTRMSHEMRTPLTGVISALALLADQQLPRQARELVDLANSSSGNLLRVINYVLDISRLEVGNTALDTAAFSLPDLLAKVTSIVRARAMEKQLELVWSASPRLNEAYVADKTKLRQCLLNLVTNALKFTVTGGVTVRALPSALGDPAMVRFEVEDTGVGISADDQKQVFEPFFTGGREHPAADKGTGLGLDIVRRYVEVMEGKYGVSSRLGRGSLFWLEIPMQPADDMSVEDEDAQRGGRRAPRQFQGRVLIVDDNRTNLMLGRMILESLGLDVQEAEDGASAVSRAHGEPYDLVLMDLNMPGMDGLDATREIRKFAPADKLPVVALTAYASSAERERCAAAGMNGYLTKPIVRDRLAEQLAAWLEGAPDRADGTQAATEPRADDAPCLDTAVLATLEKQIGAASLGTVLDQFQAEVHTRWKALAEASRGGNRDSVIREAHTLASTCRSLGLTAAGDHFSALEDLLRSGPETAVTELHTSQVLLERSLDELATYRRER